MNKELIAIVSENLYKECLRKIPQYENNELIWILNSSTLCNFLYNVVKINDISVSKEFNKCCFNFIRQPKGDIDIIYKADRPYKFDFDNQNIKDFQNISKEKRTYNFVDSNDELSEIDFKQLCTMETKSGLKFTAKRPEYLFLYKFKEFLAIFHDEIINNDIRSINDKNQNIISDVSNLYAIALSYCGEKEIKSAMKILPNISKYLNQLYNENNGNYFKLIDYSFKIINSFLSNIELEGKSI